MLLIFKVEIHIFFRYRLSLFSCKFASFKALITVCIVFLRNDSSLYLYVWSIYIYMFAQTQCASIFDNTHVQINKFILFMVCLHGILKILDNSLYLTPFELTEWYLQGIRYSTHNCSNFITGAICIETKVIYTKPRSTLQLNTNEFEPSINCDLSSDYDQRKRSNIVNTSGEYDKGKYQIRSTLFKLNVRIPEVHGTFYIDLATSRRTRTLQLLGKLERITILFWLQEANILL